MPHARYINETYRKAFQVIEQCRILSLIALEFYPGYGAKSSNPFDASTIIPYFKDVLPFWPMKVMTGYDEFHPFRPNDWNNMSNALKILQWQLSSWPAKVLEILDERVSLPHLSEEHKSAPFLIQIEKVNKQAKIVGDLVDGLYTSLDKEKRNAGQAILQETIQDPRSFLADEEALNVVQMTIDQRSQNAVYWKRAALLESVKIGATEPVSASDLLLSPWNDYAPILSDRKLYLGPHDPGLSLPQTKFQQMDALAVWNDQVALYEDVLSIREKAVKILRRRLPPVLSFEESFDMVTSDHDLRPDTLNYILLDVNQISTLPRSLKEPGFFRVAGSLYQRFLWQSSAILRTLASFYSHEVSRANMTRNPTSDIHVDTDYSAMMIAVPISLMIARQKGLVPREATFDDVKIFEKVAQIRDSLPRPNLARPKKRYEALLAEVA